MKKHISMPSIEQFRNIVTNINRQFNFIGLDVNGEAIYDTTLPKPVLRFVGTIKLHGSNASCCFNDIDGLWAQSREDIITPEKDNAGFAFFVESNKETLLQLFDQIKQKHNLDLSVNTISIFGEWVGKGIQKGVGITNLEKSFFIFGAKISPFEIEGLEKQTPAYWVDHSYLRAPENRIYNINDYQTYSIDIDFNTPQLVQNKLSEITRDVENECPVAKSFGFSGIGEGIVWMHTTSKGTRYLFKVKGEKHSTSKVRTLASVDVDKLNSIKEFVDYSVTESRFNQGLEKTFINGEPIDIKKMGDLIKWVVKDVMKEEMDTMVSNKIEPKEVNKYISSKVREMFFKLV